MDQTVDEMYRCVKRFVPKHRMGEYHIFVQLASMGLLDGMIEEGIAKGILKAPPNRLGAQGVLLAVRK